MKALDVGDKGCRLISRSINAGRGTLMSIEECYSSREALNRVGG